MTPPTLTRQNLMDALSKALHNELCRLESELKSLDGAEFMGDNKRFLSEAMQARIAKIKALTETNLPSPQSSSVISDYSIAEIQESRRVDKKSASAPFQKWIFFAHEFAGTVTLFTCEGVRIFIQPDLLEHLRGAKAGDTVTVEVETHMGYWETTTYYISKIWKN